MHAGDNMKASTLALAVVDKHCTSDESLCNQDPEVVRALKYLLSSPGAVNSG